MTVFSYLQSYCIEWYLENNIDYLIEIGNGRYKLPLNDKKQLLCACLYGIDIDIRAVEVANFSLLIKLIENETSPSVSDSLPILPDLGENIFHGNALVGSNELQNQEISHDELFSLVPFDWDKIIDVNEFDAIVGNPPYVNIEGMHTLLSPLEVSIYKNNYVSAYKQFDKYFVFIEQVINKVKHCGYVCFIVPNKFFKIGAGEKLRQIIAEQALLVSLDDFGDAQLFEDKTIYSSIILLRKCPQNEFVYSSVDSENKLWSGEGVKSFTFDSSILDKQPWKLTTDFELLQLAHRLEKEGVYLSKHAENFNGIQTSAERPTPVYWFSTDEILEETELTYKVQKGEIQVTIEKAILKPYFKPTRKSEKGLNSYSILKTDKWIIFPYDEHGVLIPIDILQLNYPGTYKYLSVNYNRLVPKCVSPEGTRDVPNATIDTWYQYGRTQALRDFVNTPKLIVGVLSQSPMYAYDNKDMLITSGGTAGYCAVSRKFSSPYSLEYIQAWLSNPYTEKIIRITGSEFEGGFVARGTFILPKLPFIELDFSVKSQKELHDKVVELTYKVYDINSELELNQPKAKETVLIREKNRLVENIEILINRVYRLEF